MGKPFEPCKVKFFCGLIFRQESDLERLKYLLEGLWGALDRRSGILPFNYTDYYYEEMGRPLYRTFWSFRNLMDRENLPDRKIESNAVENEFCRNGVRQVNIDPGYLTLGQLILATTKDREHRIYIGKGIYAEVTLPFVQGDFLPYPWTYRDYASDEYRVIFREFRQDLKREMKHQNLRKAVGPSQVSGTGE